MNKQKGFTIVELIVVVAIIAVLAAIVIFNVTSYITKGKDAGARGNLASAMGAGAVYYDTYSNYADFFTDPGFTGPEAALGTAGYTSVTKAIKTDNSAWCAMVTLKTAPQDTFCVDSTGNKLEKAGGTCTDTTGTCL